MSDTKSYKTVTFSNAQGFVVQRALRNRLDQLYDLKRATGALGDTRSNEYLDAQIADCHSTLELFRSIPYRAALPDSVVMA